MIENGLGDQQDRISPSRRVVGNHPQLHARGRPAQSRARDRARLPQDRARRSPRARQPPEQITPEMLQKYLGPPKFFSEVAERTQEPGVATGLAWTPNGGDILFIESTRMNGQKGLTLTGSLGDVMKESAQAALSYIRSRADRLGIAPDFFEKSDIHVHVPAGAIPKDGPSAGVTIAASLASLLTGRPVRSDVAMTGEITLRGKVLPVGGIKEKVLAARRAGIKTDHPAAAQRERPRGYPARSRARSCEFDLRRHRRRGPRARAARRRSQSRRRKASARARRTNRAELKPLVPTSCPLPSAGVDGCPRMKIAIVAAEMRAVHAKAGGLADVIGALPPRSKRAAPSRSRDSSPGLRGDARRCSTTTPVCGTIVQCRYGGCRPRALPAAARGRVPATACRFPDRASGLFRRATASTARAARTIPTICGAISSSGAPPRIALRSCIQPDVVHAHDWHAAVAPIVMRADPALREALRARALSVFTIHNLAFQGILEPARISRLLNIDRSYYLHRIPGVLRTRQPDEGRDRAGRRRLDREPDLRARGEQRSRNSALASRGYCATRATASSASSTAPTTTNGTRPSTR